MKKNPILPCTSLLFLAFICCFGKTLGQAPSVSRAQLELQLQRNVALLGSYLNVIADTSIDADANVKSQYKKLAKDLFADGAKVEVSSKSKNKTTTYEADYYIDEHFKELTTSKGYSTIKLQWIKVTSSGKNDDGYEFIVTQTFEAGNVNNPNKYSDLTLKSAKVSVSTMSGERADAKFQYDAIKIVSIRVIETNDLNSKGSQAATMSSD